MPLGDRITLTAALLTGLLSYFVTRLYYGPRVPGLRLAPQLSRRTILGLILGHVVDALDRRYGPEYSAQLRWCSDITKVGFTRFVLGYRIFTANPGTLRMP
jgi:hypothetical protein